jgi:hypothetical protein
MHSFQTLQSTYGTPLVHIATPQTLFLQYPLGDISFLTNEQTYRLLSCCEGQTDLGQSNNAHQGKSRSSPILYIKGEDKGAM